jgi:hypothetical protein
LIFSPSKFSVDILEKRKNPEDVKKKGTAKRPIYFCRPKLMDFSKAVSSPLTDGDKRGICIKNTKKAQINFTTSIPL